MKIKLDKKTDALYIRIKSGKIHKTIAENSFLIDIDKKGGLVGVEVLNYSKSVPGKFSVVFGENRKRLALPARS